MKRTDSDKLNREPIIVTLGGKDYSIIPQPMKFTKVWRKEAQSLFDSIHKQLRIDTSDSESILTAVKAGLFTVYDDAVELFFQYCPHIDRKEIEENATDDEMVEAIIELGKLAFPLVKRLVNVKLGNVPNMKQNMPNQ